MIVVLIVLSACLPAVLIGVAVILYAANHYDPSDDPML